MNLFNDDDFVIMVFIPLGIAGAYLALYLITLYIQGGM